MVVVKSFQWPTARVVQSIWSNMTFLNISPIQTFVNWGYTIFKRIFCILNKNSNVTDGLSNQKQAHTTDKIIWKKCIFSLSLQSITISYDWINRTEHEPNFWKVFFPKILGFRFAIIEKLYFVLIYTSSFYTLSVRSLMTRFFINRILIFEKLINFDKKDIPQNIFKTIRKCFFGYLLGKNTIIMLVFYKNFI
jgi:hypothetical protein